MGATKSLTAARLAPSASDPAATAAGKPSEAQVLAGVLAGERWAHAALFDLLYPVVARSLHKILRDKSGDYEDLVQQSFERIVRTLVGERRTQVVSLSAWAGSIAAHVALDALRAKMRERRLFERDGASAPLLARVPSANLEQQLEARQKLEWLQKALATMNADQAQTVLLHDVLGHGLSEVAAMMSVTLAAAQRRLSRGHQELLRRAAARDKERS